MTDLKIENNEEIGHYGQTLISNINHHRTMIGMFCFGQDARRLKVWQNIVRDNMIINTPSLVVVTGIGAVTPPAVLVRFFYQMPERIGITQF